MGSNRQAPVSSAVIPSSMSAIAFASGGALAVVAGALVIPFLTFNPSIRIEFTVKALVVVDGSASCHGRQSGCWPPARRGRRSRWTSSRFRPTPSQSTISYDRAPCPAACGLFGTATAGEYDAVFALAALVATLLLPAARVARVRLRPGLHGQAVMLSGADYRLGAVFRHHALRLTRHGSLLRHRGLYGSNT